MRFLRVFNPSRLPIIYFFNRIYNLNMILFIIFYGRGVSSANLHILHSQHDSSEYTQLGYNLFTFGFNHCWSKFYLHSVELLEFEWNTHLLEFYQWQTRRKKALIPTCDLYSFDVCARLESYWVEHAKLVCGSGILDLDRFEATLSLTPLCILLFIVCASVKRRNWSRILIKSFQTREKTKAGPNLLSRY